MASPFLEFLRTFGSSEQWAPPGSAGKIYILVTGATGYIAAELIKQLLERGFSVRGTVRSLTSEHARAAREHLQRLASALPGKLELVEADLEVPGSFHSAVAGCRYVFHTASPFFTVAEDPERQLIGPAVHGTKNVIDAVAAAGKGVVKRLVLTSSFAAVASAKDRGVPKNGEVFTEEDWNERSTVQDEPYFVSKKRAEQAAWELAAAHGIDMVAINPTFVLGPVYSQRLDSTSVKAMKSWLEGGAPATPMRSIDIRDVAKAHILAAITPCASGRYIVSCEETIPSADIMAVLAREFPEWDLAAGTTAPRERILSTAKLQRDLGLVPAPIKCAIKDMARTMVALGIAHPKRK
eukprot:jgi/Mesvir1/16656/Mv10193-RA.1